jgi:hypothetical protein
MVTLVLVLSSVDGTCLHPRSGAEEIFAQGLIVSCWKSDVIDMRDGAARYGTGGVDVRSRLPRYSEVVISVYFLGLLSPLRRSGLL